jgi:hypothetical protein
VLGLIRITVKTVSESGAFIDFARRRNVHEELPLPKRSAAKQSDGTYLT